MVHPQVKVGRPDRPWPPPLPAQLCFDASAMVGAVLMLSRLLGKQNKRRLAKMEKETRFFLCNTGMSVKTVWRFLCISNLIIIIPLKISCYHHEYGRLLAN